MYSIYLISLPEGDYVGSGLKPCGRLASHIRQFNDGTHPNPNIRDSESEVTDWVFQILECGILKKDLAARESYWIGEYGSLNIKSKSNARLDRDTDVLQLLKKGLSYRQVAEQANVSVGTVGNIVARNK